VFLFSSCHGNGHGNGDNQNGQNGNQTDNSVTHSGAVYVFVSNSGVWSQEAYVKASNTEADDLFGEGDGRVVITAAQADVAALRELAGDLPLREIGTVGGSVIRVGAAGLSLAEAAALHDAGIPNAVGA